MALADILEKIESDASQERDRILGEAEETVRGIENNAKKELEQFEAQAKINRERRATKVAERILSSARHKAKFIRESFKNSVIDAVFAEVRQKLIAISDDAYSTYVQQALLKIGDDAPHAQYAVAEERADQTKKILVASGVPQNSITVHPEGTLLGGFVASTETKEFDFSFASLLKRVREEKEISVSKELF